MGYRSDNNDSEGGFRPRSNNRFGSRDRNSGSSGGFGGRSSGGFSRDRRPVEMHDAICDKCKKECQVPFKPSSDKPVLCSDCFKKEGGSSSRGSPGVSAEQFKELNTKLDKILKLLEAVEIVEDENDDDEEDEDEVSK